MTLILALALAGLAQQQPALPSGSDPFTPGPGSPLPVGPMAGRPALADMNGDGRLDLVLACGTCCGSSPHPESGHVVVLLGDGKGGMVRAEGFPLPIGSSARKVAVGDVDGDGDLDVAVAQHDSYEVVVLRGDGTGALAVAPSDRFAAAAGPRAHTHEVALADLDRDGDLDLLTTNVNDGTVSALHNDGAGRYPEDGRAQVAAGRHPYDSIAVLDANGDGMADFVVPNMAVHGVSVLLAKAGGGYEPAHGSPIGLGPRPGYLSAGDLDGDGDADLVAGHDDDPLLSVLLGDGKGGFAPAPGSPLVLAAPAWGSALADFDGDGRLDAALASPQLGVLVLAGDGAGRFTHQLGEAIPAGDLAMYVAAGDVDGDARPDVVASAYGSGTVTILLNRAGAAARRAGPQAFDLAAALARLTAPPGADDPARRLAWASCMSAHGTDAVFARLTQQAEAEPASAAPRVRLGAAYVELIEVARGGAAIRGWATAAEQAFDQAIALDAGDRQARWLRAKVLSLWPPAAGRTPAAIAELVSLLALAERAEAPRAEVERAERLLAELRRRPAR
jgi:hypothetical protein